MPLIQIINPLEWPQYRPQTSRLMRSNDNNFQQDLADHEAVAFLQEEINNFPIEIAAAVLSLDAMNVSSPLPSQYLSKNTGACLRITIEENRYFIACDKWQKMSHNIYSLHLALRYFKQLTAWGIGDIHTVMGGMSENYIHSIVSSQGNNASSNHEQKQWMAVLGLGPTATIDDANAVYRQRALKIGEDDPDALQELNLAITEARKQLS